MGRPSKLTPETQQRIVQAIEVGATYELAASYGGIAYNTFNEWMKKGEAARSGRFYDFYEAIKAAEGKAAIKWLALIDKAAADSWQAAAWKLERRYPDTFGRRVQDTRVSAPDGGPVQHEHTVNLYAEMDDDQLRRLLDD